MEIRPTSPLLVAAVLASLAMPSGAPNAAPTGAIYGEISDAATGSTLPGATVYLPVHGKAAIADDKGRFQLSGLATGFYTLEISVVGYTRWRRDDVRVTTGDTTRITAQLAQTVLPLGVEIVVIGRRSVIEVGEPTTRRTLRRADLELTAPGLVEAVMRQPGVSQVDREIHVRGARTYETDYLVDGVTVTDPYLRQGMGVRLTSGSVERLELHASGIRAGLGGASGGVVSVETIEPTDELQGQVTYLTDAFSPSRAGDWDSDRAELSIYGPVSSLRVFRESENPSFAPGFVASVGAALTDTHLGSGSPNSSVWGGRRWSPRSDNRYNALFKLSWRVSSVHKVSALFTGESAIDQDASALDTRLRTATYSYGWPFAYARMLEHANTYTRQSNSQIFRWNLRTGNETSFTLTGSRVFSRMHTDANGKSPSEYEPPEDTGPVIITPLPDSTSFEVRGGDGFYDVGDGDLWHDHFVETYALRLDASFAPRRTWSLDIGLEAAPQTLQVVDIFRPWLGLAGLNTDHYRVRPSTAACWAQTRFNVEGTVIDFGLRGEAWWPGAYLEALIADTTLPNISPVMRDRFGDQTIDVLGHRARIWALPRLGISHAIGPSMSLFANYDRFARRPNARYVYAKLTSRSPSTFQLLGNPSLKPERTIAIEGGIKWLWNPDWGLTASVYQRDIRDYIAAVAFIPDLDQPEDFWYAYANHDIAQSRGIEATLDGRKGSTFRTAASITIARVRGEHSLPDDVFRGRVSRENGLLFQDVSLDWDKPWKGSLSFEWTFGPGDHPSILGLSPGGNWDAGISFWAEAGKRFTPYRDSLTEVGDVVYLRNGAPNSGVGPNWQSLDLSLARHFSVGETRLTAFIDVVNVFNHENLTLVNPVTGEGYRAGEQIPTGDNFFETAPFGFELPIWDDPARLDNPVHWQFGLRWSW